MSPEVTCTFVVTLALLVYAMSAHDVTSRSKRNAYRSSLGSRIPSWFPQMNTDGFSGVRDMSEFIPAIPTEGEINCHIEYEVVRAVGGRCVRLGGAHRTAVCQSGIYLDLQNQECENILRARETQEQHDAPSPLHGHHSADGQ